MILGIRGRGGIGRRARLRIWWYPRAGSSPVARTKKEHPCDALFLSGDVAQNLLTRQTLACLFCSAFVEWVICRFYVKIILLTRIFQYTRQEALRFLHRFPLLLKYHHEFLPYFFVTAER